MVKSVAICRLYRIFGFLLVVQNGLRHPQGTLMISMHVAGLARGGGSSHRWQFDQAQPKVVESPHQVHEGFHVDGLS